MKTTTAAVVANPKKVIMPAKGTPPPRYQSTEAEQVIRKAVTIIAFKVPSRVAALLPKRGDYVVIHSASIPDVPNMIQARVNHWLGYSRDDCGKWSKPIKSYLAAVQKKPCDTLVSVFFPTAEWKRIEHLALLLMIDPADWLLACANYNASLIEQVGKGVR